MAQPLYCVNSPPRDWNIPSAQVTNEGLLYVSVWDQTKCSRFRWLWYDATTFAPYTEETSYENSILVQQSGALALSSLTHVMKSLTPNAKGIFLLLARNQLEHKDSSNYIGMYLFTFVLPFIRSCFVNILAFFQSIWYNHESHARKIMFPYIYYKGF